MDDQERDAERERRQWAAALVAGLGAAEDIERTLAAALDPRPDLSAENGVRRARAVHAAALGFGPAGCAAAAGIPEAMLARWRVRDPAFDGALTAASALGPAHQAGGIGGFGLRLLLQAVAGGVRASSAAAMAGLRPDQLLRLRRANPQVSALLDAAVRQARGRRGKDRGTRPGHSYRLVQVPDAGPRKPPG
ncbi:hypothetical protein ACGFXC_24710 [Streptomyces sp. NPDC048507]|uniref:hypothetical protein n=1 Tax=Streptomyces sp. NPDC048507 TaxID=3365560 RepID=UPI0037190527